MYTPTPVVRAALLAALASPGRALVRGCGGYIALTSKVTASGNATFPAFTRRAMNWLERDGLANFDEPDFPRRVTLTPKGIGLAERLRDESTKPRRKSA